MLPSNEKPLLQIPSLTNDGEENLDEEFEEVKLNSIFRDFLFLFIATWGFQEEKKIVDKSLELPPSWVLPIEITPKGL